MSSSSDLKPWPPEAPGLDLDVIQFAGMMLFGAVFILYSRSWQDFGVLAYDLPAALVVGGFLGRLLADGVARPGGRQWGLFAATSLLLAVITVGRECKLWPISGHVVNVTAVAIMQGTDRRLSLFSRFLPAATLPLLIAFRILRWDGRIAPPLWMGLLVGGLLGATAVALASARVSGPSSSGRRAGTS